MSLKPWREIAIPHEDVLKGTFKQAEFAADLSLVHDGAATPEYQDARPRVCISNSDALAKHSAAAASGTKSPE